MCFALDSEPPIPVALNANVRGENLVLSASDGTRFNAFAAHPDTLTPSATSVVILPDVRGLYRFYRDLAMRFAEAGITAVAIDFFGRTAGLTPREDDFDYMPHVQQTTPETIAQDVASAVAYLRAQPGAERQHIFTVGFCFGGAHSFLQSANKLGLSGVIGFYGRVGGEARFGGKTATERVPDFETPVLGLFGGADQAIPVETIHQFDEALARQGIDHEIVIYPGAPHSFFDKRYEEYAKESADSWQRVLTFISQHSN